MRSEHTTVPLLAERILAQAKLTPDAIAVRGQRQQLTYAELLGRAGTIADHLAVVDDWSEHRVAVCARRSPQALAALLGCWFAGAAYVPIDTTWPATRIATVLADCEPITTLVDVPGQDLVDGPTLPLDVPAKPLDAVRARPLAGDALAHILYTSGSSGRPKGVLTTHRNIGEFASHVGDWAPGVSSTMRSAGVASWGFDAATYDLFVPLLNGGSVCLVSDEERCDPARLQAALSRMSCSFGFFTPTLLSLLRPDDLPALRTLVLGGEPVPAELAKSWAAGPDRIVFDAYGPTETTVSQTAIRVDPTQQDPMPIGHDLPGQRSYVLDSCLQPVPDGGTGELCIAGVGVARGYQGLPGRTAAAFVPDPYGKPGARMYRTGDLVRRAPDGALTYLGRLDDQVKIRGQRVEPDELAHTLRTEPTVREVSVISARIGTDTALVAFVAPAEVDCAALRAFAAERLPESLVPSRVVALDHLPMATTGKVDRNALRELMISDSSEPDPRPGHLARLWHDVLGVAATPASDFFSAGGHSITAMRLVAGIRGAARRDVSVDDVFRCRTFGALQDCVAAAAPLIDRLPEGSAPVPTPAQQRLWLVERLSRQGASSYNVTFAVRIGPGLDFERLAAALTRVEEAHDVLRWRFMATPDGPRIEVRPSGPVPLTVRPCPGDRAAAMTAAVGAERLSLEDGRPWRATLLALDDGGHVLVLSFHHCVMDGWSEQALFAQLQAAYADPETPLPAGRFADYTVWRRERDRRDFDSDLAWWTEHLAGVPDVLDLPRDRERPIEPTERAGRLARRLDDGAADTIRQVASDQGTTSAAVVLAALGIALRRLTGQRELLVAAMRVDRPFPELESSIGFYIDMQPVRLRVDDEESAAELVRHTHHELLAGAAHPAVGFQDLVTALNVRRAPGRQPLLQVAFNVYNFPDAAPALDGLGVERQLPPVAGSPFDLSVYLVDDAAGMRIESVYSAELYERSRADDMLSSLVDVIVDSTAKPDRPIGSVSGVFRTDTVTEARSAAVSSAGPAAVQNDTEARVARIWREVLQVDDVSATVNFFDAGGSSLAISQVHHRLTTDLERDVPVVTLFQHPTIRAFARYLDGATAGAALERASTIAAARRARSRRRSRP